MSNKYVMLLKVQSNIQVSTISLNHTSTEENLEK